MGLTFDQSSYLSQISQIIFVEEKLSCGEILGSFGEILENFGKFWEILENFWEIWGNFWEILGTFAKFWGKFGEIWGTFGTFWEILGDFATIYTLSCEEKLNPKITFVEKKFSCGEILGNFEKCWEI